MLQRRWHVLRITAQRMLRVINEVNLTYIPGKSVVHMCLRVPSVVLARTQRCKYRVL